MKTFPLMLLFWDRKNSNGSKRYVDIQADTIEQAIAEARAIYPSALSVMNLDPDRPLNLPDWTPIKDLLPAAVAKIERDRQLTLL